MVPLLPGQKVPVLVGVGADEVDETVRDGLEATEPEAVMETEPELGEVPDIEPEVEVDVTVDEGVTVPTRTAPQIPWLPMAGWTTLFIQQVPGPGAEYETATQPVVVEQRARQSV